MLSARENYCPDQVTFSGAEPSHPTTMQAAVIELWEEIPQEWINELIDKQEYWVHELIKRCGWSTAN
jgi:hypothetical protein